MLARGPAVCVATQDWHPAGHVSFASAHPGREPFDRVVLHGHEQVLWPDHCVQGTRGAELHPQLPWHLVSLILRKGSEPTTDSYSAFRDNRGPLGTRETTGLAGYLRERGIRRVEICGLAREVCCKWTAEDAADLGFGVDFLWDLTRAVDPLSDEATRGDLERRGVRVLRDTTAAEPESVRGPGSGRRALVLGGSGKMGGFFVRFLASQGFLVEVADPAGPREGFPHRADWSAGGIDHDVVVVAAPLRASNLLLHALAERRPPGLVFDIGSLKAPLRSGLSALVASGTRAASLHPMFGPDVRDLAGRHVVFVDVGRADALRQAEALFEPTAAVRVRMDLDAHDHVMAYVLGLSHALNLAFVDVLAASGTPRLAASSTTFDAQLAVAGAVARDDARLYFEIQRLNPFGDESVSALLRSVERVRALVRAGDEESFVRLMQENAAYLRRRG
jgi:chorismate mutase/prephenate dehydrogenase